MATNATPFPSRSRGTVELTRDCAEVGDHTQQKRGPEVGPPCSPSITLQYGAEVGDHTQQNRGPAVRPSCSPIITLRDVIAADYQSLLRQGAVLGRHFSPVNRVRSRHESHLDPLASLSHTQTSPSGWQGSLEDEDSSFKSEQNPFLAIPGLEDCHLSGLRSALSKPVEEVTTSDRQKALWLQAHGGAEIRQVGIFRSEALYSSEVPVHHSYHLNCRRKHQFLTTIGKQMLLSRNNRRPWGLLLPHYPKV